MDRSICFLENQDKLYRGERSSAKFWGTDGQEMGAVNGFLMDTVAISVSGHQRRQEWEAGMEFPFWLLHRLCKVLRSLKNFGWGLFIDQWFLQTSIKLSVCFKKQHGFENQCAWQKLQLMYHNYKNTCSRYGNIFVVVDPLGWAYQN